MAALVPTINAMADTKSDALLTALQKKVVEWGNYRVEFSVTIDGQSLNGTYEVGGNSYHIETPDVEVFCDGRTKYEVSLPDEEIIIDNVNPDDRTILGNPTQLFDFLGGSFSHRYIGKALINGTGCDQIELQENGAKKGEVLNAFINSQTGMPARLIYRLGGLNADAVVDIIRITPNITIDSRDFSLDTTGRYPGFEIIDFR